MPIQTSVGWLLECAKRDPQFSDYDYYSYDISILTKNFGKVVSA
jgi:hypothetical protein